MRRWCRQCLARQTLNEAEEPNGLCRVCAWRREARGYDAREWYVNWFTRTRGRQTRQLPEVLHPDFPLKSCPQCGDPIHPWERTVTRRGKRVRSWCTPGMYSRRQTCGSQFCAGDLHPETRVTSGAFVGMKEVKR